MDETGIKIKGQWRYLYRAVNKASQTIDFLLMAHRDKKAALRFLKKAAQQQVLPDKVAIDRSGGYRGVSGGNRLQDRDPPEQVLKQSD